MARRKGLTDDELSTLCDGWVQDALAHDSSEAASLRGKALDFYEGRIDIASEPNKSQVVSPDLANVLEWIHPSLLRVFMAGEKIVEYKPNTPEDEETARQATAGVNHEFMRGEIGGFSVISAGLHDALLHGNGIIKHWWEGAKEYKTETLTGLSEEEYFALLSDETVEEVLEKREYFVGPDGEEIDPERAPLQIDDEQADAAQEQAPTY